MKSTVASIIPVEVVEAELVELALLELDVALMVVLTADDVDALEVPVVGDLPPDPPAPEDVVEATSEQADSAPTSARAKKGRWSMGRRL